MSGRNGSTTPTPVPMGKVFLLGMIQLVNNTSIWMIFSFLPFMVAFYYPSMPTTELGFEAGILGSAFSAGGLVGNLVSGIISDRVGRRPALLWGLMGTAISSLCFGFSPTFWFAVTARFLWGVLNGNIGVVKTYLAEISDDSNLARIMAYFGVIGSTGRIIGPIIGGLLSYPADNFSIFRHTMFDTYPFALPCMVVCINCVLTFVVAFYYLPETLKIKGGIICGFNPSSDSISNSNDISRVGSRLGLGKGKSSRDGVQYTALQTSDADSPSQSAVSLPDSFGRHSTALDDADLDFAVELPSMRSSHDKNGSHSSATGVSGSEKNGCDESLNPLLSSEISHVNGVRNGRFMLLDASNKRFSGETDEESDSECKSSTEANAPSSSSSYSPQAASPVRPDKTPPGGDVDLELGQLRHSPLRPGGGQLSGKQRKKKAISFSSRVKVKIIDRPEVTIQSLKQVAPDETPIFPNSTGSSSGSGSAVGSPGRVRNGSSNRTEVASPLYEDEEASVDSSSSSGAVDSSGDGVQESLIPEVRYSNGAEYFESVNSNRSLWSNLAYLMRQRQVLITTTLYGVSSFVVIISNEIFTLWVVTSPADGGLSYTTKQIGTAIMICGVISTLLQLTLYPAANDYLGVLAVHRIGGMMVAVACVLTPLLGWHAAGRPAALTMVLVVLVLTLSAVAANWYLVSTFVLISNSCYRHQLATVNGIGQTCASIGRLCGPYLGSVLFAWSETNGLAWPFNQYFVFYVLALLAMAIYQYSLLLPRSIQRRKREPKFRTFEEADEFLRKQAEEQQRREQEQGQLDDRSAQQATSDQRAPVTV